MKKGIIIGAVGVAAIAGVGPYFVGQHAQQVVEDYAGMISENTVYSAKVTQHNRTWFTSQGKLEITLDLRQLAQDFDQDPSKLESFTFDVDYDITHGPFLFNGGVPVGLMSFVAQVDNSQLPEDVEWPQAEPVYQLDGRVGLFGGFSFSDYIPAIEYEDKAKLTFSGYRGEGYVGDNLEYTGKAEKIEVTRENRGAFVISDVVIDMELEGSYSQMMETGFAPGKQSFSIGKVFIDADGVKADVENAFVSLKMEEPTETLRNMGISYGVSKFEAQEVVVTDAEITVDFNSVHRVLIDTLTEVNKDMANASPEQLQIAMMEFLQKDLLTVLQAGPELNFSSVKFTLPEGSFNGYLNTKLVNITQLPAMANDPMYWVKHVNSNGKIEADHAVFEKLMSLGVRQNMSDNPQFFEMTAEEQQQAIDYQIGMMINQGVQAGVVTKDDTHYRTEVKVVDGVVTVNGTPLFTAP